MIRRLAGGAAAVNAAPALAPVWRPAARALGVPRRLADQAAGIALTFDDGPHPEGTPLVLEALARAGARATFFMIGEQVERNPALAAEVAAAGHEIALHGHRHRLVLRVAPGAFADDLDRGAAVIQDATGVVPALHRPPYGIYSTAGLVLARRRFRPLLWSRWGRDWRRHITPERIAQLVTRELSPGDVLLLHDADTYSQAGSHRRTAAALPLVLDAVERLGTAVAGPIGERALAV